MQQSKMLYICQHKWGRYMYPVADKLPNEVERAAFVEALALIGTDQQDEYYSFCEI